MIKKFIDRLPKDKKDHVLLGIILGYPLMLIGFIIDLFFFLNFYTFVGALIATLLVASKEVIIDWIQGKGNPEFYDFLASWIPILIMMSTFTFGLMLVRY